MLDLLVRLLYLLESFVWLSQQLSHFPKLLDLDDSVVGLLSLDPHVHRGRSRLGVIGKQGTLLGFPLAEQFLG